MTGYPISSAIFCPSSASYTASFVPGTTGTPASIIVFLAADLLPMRSMISADGPMNVILHFSHILTNLLFSDKTPNPGWIASAPTAIAAPSTRSMSR